MFNMESRPSITESVVESADSAVKSTDSTTDSAVDPVKIGLYGPLVVAHTQVQ